MRQFEATNGIRKVITTQDGPKCAFHSRLYVNGGETATLVAAIHKTERGARTWAARQLAN